jgi:MFS family permease
MNSLRHRELSSPWRVLIPVGIGTGLSLIGDSGLYAVLPTHGSDAGVALFGVGILLSANRFIRLISNGSVGWICDRWPRRWIFVPALFLGAFSTSTYALTRGLWPLLIGRLLWGIAWSGIWIAGNAIIFDITDDQSRGRWVGLYHISFFMGAASGSMLGGTLTDWIGFHGAMWVAFCLNLTGALVAFLFLPETRLPESVRMQTRSAVETQAMSLAGKSKLTEIVSITALMGVNRIVIAGILVSTFGIFLHDLLGDSVTIGNRVVGVATLTGLGLGLSTVTSMFLTPLLGGLSDRVRNRWRVVTVGLLAGTAGFSMLASGISAVVIPALPLIFLSSSSNQGLSTALMGDRSSNETQGRLLGILFTVGDLGSAIGPPLAYWLIPSVGARGVYWLGAGLFLAMFILSGRWAIVARPVFRDAAAGRQPKAPTNP